MPQEDVDIVRRAFEAWNAGDLERVIALVHPELEFFPLRSQLDGSGYSGAEGVRQFAADTAEEWDYLQIRPDELRVMGKNVLMLGRFDARGRVSGMEIEFPCGWVARVRDGKVVYLRAYSDHHGALKAAGANG